MPSVVLSSLYNYQTVWCCQLRKTIKCTVDEGSIEPLHVVALWEGEQHLIGQNGDGEKEHSTHCDRQGERTQPQPGRRRKTGYQ